MKIGIIICDRYGNCAGGILGSSLAIKTKPRLLKLLFALTTLAASVVMAINALVAK